MATQSNNLIKMVFPYSFWNQNKYFVSSTAINETGLILYYQLDSVNNVQTITLDSTTNHNNASIINNNQDWGNWSRSSGILGSGIFFETISPGAYTGVASTPYLATTGSGIDLGIKSGSSLSVCFWAYLSGNFNYGAIPQYVSFVGNDSHSLGMVNSTRHCFFGLRAVGQNTLLFPSLNITGEAVSSNRWNFFVGWFDTGNATINVQMNNGTVYSTSAANGNIIIGPDYFNITKQNYAPINSATYHMLFDEVSLWQRVLTTQERAFLYNNGRGKTYPLTNA